MTLPSEILREKMQLRYGVSEYFESNIKKFVCIYYSRICTRHYYIMHNDLWRTKHRVFFCRHFDVCRSCRVEGPQNGHLLYESKITLAI